MKGLLRATVQSAPKATLYRATGGVALVSTALALWFVALFHLYFGTVLGYVLIPVLVAALAWLCAGAARLRLVGLLPSDSDRFIPTQLQPWIRLWLLVRIGLLGAMLLLLAAIIGTAAAGLHVTYPGQALVYVVTVRIFLDLAFAAAFNLGVISRRNLSR